MSSKRGQLARDILDTVPEGRLNAVVLHMMRERDIPLPGADGKVLTNADFKEQIASFVERLNVRDLDQRRAPSVREGDGWQGRQVVTEHPVILLLAQHRSLVAINLHRTATRDRAAL